MKILLTILAVAFAMISHSQFADTVDWSDSRPQAFYGKIIPKQGVYYDGQGMTILRMPTAGTQMDINSFEDFINWTRYKPPTITINISGTYPVEVGTSQTITISGTVTNYGDVLSNGAVTSAQATNNPIIYFDDAESYTSDITFAPTQGGTTDFTKLSYTFVAYVDYAGTETGYKEASATVSSVYATYWGVSETAFEESTTGTAIWTAFNSTRQIWSDINSFRSRTYTADNEYIVYAYPRSYGAPTQILNPSGFNEILGFDIWEITVTNTVTSGITNPSTDVEYYLVQSKLPMSGMTNFAYRFYY